MSSLENGILIIDYGSQYTQLIARRVREAHVYCEIHTPPDSAEEIRRQRPKGVILSGGPSSVYDDEAPLLDVGLAELEVPVLGVCYGMYLVALAAGGQVERAGESEYGRAELEVERTEGLFAGFGAGERQACPQPLKATARDRNVMGWKWPLPSFWYRQEGTPS